jgi:hypothetical protein
MKSKKKKYLKIKPNYIKDSKGKVLEIYLDIKTFNAIVKTVNKFEKIKKEVAEK